MDEWNDGQVTGKDFAWLLSLETVPAGNPEAMDDWSEIVFGCRFFASGFRDKTIPCFHEDCGQKVYDDPDQIRMMKAYVN